MSGRSGSVAAALVTLAVAGCGSSGSPAVATSGFRPTPHRAIPRSLLAGERPIGRGPRFQPRLNGTPTGECSRELGPRNQAHVELFGADRVILLSAGIGTTSRRRFLDGRLTNAGCFGSIVTLDPTGTVYFRPGLRPTLAALFRAWGHPLTPTRIASFAGTVSVYVDGHASSRAPGAIQLTSNVEIVLEVGPHVPPHSRFIFPQPPSSTLR